MALAFALLAFLTQAPAESGGEFVNGNKLYQMCTEDEASPNHFQFTAWCTGYILGTYDTLRGSGLSSNLSICVPATVDSGQLTDMVVKSLREHPEVRQNSASMLVGATLRAYFKCDSGSAK